MWGGCFGGEDQTKKDLHSEFGRFLCSKTGEDQKEKKRTSPKIGTIFEPEDT